VDRSTIQGAVIPEVEQVDRDRIQDMALALVLVPDPASEQELEEQELEEQELEELELEELGQEEEQGMGWGPG